MKGEHETPRGAESKEALRNETGWRHVYQLEGAANGQSGNHVSKINNANPIIVLNVAQRTKRISLSHADRNK